MTNDVRNREYRCCIHGCTAVRVIRESSEARARLELCATGWALTSITSQFAKFICGPHSKRFPEYAPGKPFKRSVFVDMARLA